MSRRTLARRGHTQLAARASRAFVGIAWAVASCPYASLSAQSLDLGQYAHTAWTVRDGAPGGIRNLEQGADGVLWIASERGLFQFDGVRFERFEPPPGQTLPPHAPHVLHALADTSLWIGHFTAGVSVFHRGRIVTYGAQDGLPRGGVTAIARDSGGTMWVATSGGLARLVGGRWEAIDTAAGYPGGYTEPVLVDRSGSVWAVAGDGIYVLARGAARFEKREPTGAGRRDGELDLVAAPDGSVWAVHRSYGVFPLADGRGGPPPARTLASADTGIYSLTWSRNKPVVAIGTSGRLVRLWLSTPGGGEVGTVKALPHRSLTLPFSRTVGMSGNLIVAALYDLEGSLWVGTPTGIDRFRETKLTPIAPGYVEAAGIAPDTNGTVWIAARRGTPAALLTIGNRIVPRLDAPSMLTCIYRDLRGGLWIGGSGLWERKGNAFAPVPLPQVEPGGSAAGHEIQAVARERDGGLWLSIAFNVGVFRRRPGRGWEQFGALQGLERNLPNVITADSSGRTWLGYQRGDLVLVVGDSVRVFGAEQGLDVGRVLAVSVYGDRVWIGGQSGVMAFDAREAGGRGHRLFVPLLTAGEPLRGVSGLVETADGELWLNGADGVTRIPAGEVRRALAEPGYQVRYERLDYRDGIEPPAQQVRPLPSAAAGTDGRIWFASAGGVAWVDPRRVQRNAVPPPVQLRALTAGGRRHFAGQAGDTVRLPPRTSALSVAYTAYSLAVPDRVRFRYRLEGLHAGWQDAGDRREAFFTNLAPGRYRFHVIASNDDGVWNTKGASLAFTIDPAWNQTWWFLGLVALTLAATPALAAVAWQRRRAQRATERAQARFEAMLAERTRVARELHDTLLGGMAGVAMQLDIGARRLAAGDNTSAIADHLSTLASQARYVLAETRKVVGAMRTPPDGQPLYEQLAGAAERTFSGTEIVAHLTQTGTERSYPATLEAEIVSIAGEALANARNHSDCRTVWVICDSGPKELRVGVRDDGSGFDPSQATPTGHWGLIGMRERAESIGARLTVTSAPGAGTEVVVVLPERSRWSALWSRLRNFVPL